MNLRRNHENHETWFPPSLCDLCDEVFPDVSVDVGEADVSTGVEVGEFFVVEAELMEDGGPEVVDRGGLLDGVVAKVVGGTRVPRSQP